MKINWKVRLKNPVFWAEVALSVLLPMLTAVGLRPEDVTSWVSLWEIIKASLMNPATVVAIAVSVWNTVNDPTTAGFSDSAEALHYEEPKKSALL